MKTHKKLSINVRDLTPLKDVKGGGRRHHHRLQYTPPQFDPVTGAGKWDY